MVYLDGFVRAGRGRSEIRTSLETIAVGPLVSRGKDREFRSLVVGPGEQPQTRLDIVGDQISAPDVAGACIIRMALLTDLQLADVQSPARFEFVNRYFADPNFRELIPGHRAQEFLALSALVGFVGAVDQLAPSGYTGAGVELVVTSGDMIDNAQWNEFSLLLKTLSGGVVSADSGGPTFQGVQSHIYGDNFYWHPGPGDDLYKSLFGYPTVEGLIERAMSDQISTGLKVPWISTVGNHELLVQGVAPIGEAVNSIATGASKQLLPPWLGSRDLGELFVRSPETILSGGASVEVHPDPSRRLIDTHSLILGYLQAPGLPLGHGFSRSDLETNHGYFSYLPNDRVKLISLNTTHLLGGAAGVIDVEQFRWLEDELRSVHSRYLDGQGIAHSTANGDRYVIITSHHPLSSLDLGGSGDGERVGRLEVEALIHRYPNVILWLAGHVHRNEIKAFQPGHANDGGGFWEVVSSSIMDWPSQIRTIEVIDHRDGLISIVTEMLNSPAPLMPTSDLDQDDLASYHRLIAANAPSGGFDYPNAGTATDRNARLLLRARF